MSSCVESAEQLASRPELMGREPLSPLLARFQAARAQTESLAQPLSPEDCQIQSMPHASPVKWHLAHTTWFFENFVLVPHVRDYRVYHPSFCYLFNSYYNAVGDRHPRPRRGQITRPTLNEVYAYRAAVDRATEAYLSSAGEMLAASVAAVVELGINHEQQHQELILTDIKHALAQNPLRPAYCDGAAQPHQAEPRPMTWSYRDGGIQWLGFDGAGFAFDNEVPRHRVYCEPFQFGSRLVTCKEYLAFMLDGGYERPELWLSDGWNAVNAHGWRAPLYWENIDDNWWTTTLRGFRSVCIAEPVCHVSFYEADAFARWAGARLPTETEWELIARQTHTNGNFLECGHFHPRIATDGAEIAQCFGDVWEWTGSPYSPYPGSRLAAGALGEYNAKFMCNQLVLRGGSCITPASHIRATYRNFFSPEARWQFSGIRLAKDV